MDKVLIVDKDPDYVQSLKTGLDKMHQFEVETAPSGAAAMELMENRNFSVLVTEVFSSDMDALDLLAYMTRKRPNTPCIVITDHSKPWFKKKEAQQSFLYHMEKPVEIGKLASAIFVGLNLRDEGKNLKGMTVASILPLVEILNRTCRMEVSSKDKGKGYLYFQNGMIIDAHYKESSGEPAAREIIQWDRIFIKLSELPHSRTRSRVKTKLMDMAGASWDKNRIGGIDEIKLTPKSIRSAFQKYNEEFQKIKGYQALAVMTENGEIIASDQKNVPIHLSDLAEDINKLLSSPDKRHYLYLDKGEAVTFHKQDSTVIILKPEKETDPRILLTGLTSANGNWFYMKMNLYKLLEEILN